MSLRVSAISFLNPAPLLYDFEHEPTRSELRQRYVLHYTSPAQCAAELHSGSADLGLIPVAELTPALRIVPGCAIASLHEVRSILLLVRARTPGSVDEALRAVRTLAADSASRSSIAYTRTLLQHVYGVHLSVRYQPADPLYMLVDADAALLIGDPALMAREHRVEVDAASAEPLLWLDLAQLWREHTGLPWVAAVWAVRPEALDGELTALQLAADLGASRDHGLTHIDNLVREWTPRLSLSPETIHAYLSHNIYYHLDDDCLRAIAHFRGLAAQHNILPPLDPLPLL